MGTHGKIKRRSATLLRFLLENQNKTLAVDILDILKNVYNLSEDKLFTKACQSAYRLLYKDIQYMETLLGEKAFLIVKQGSFKIRGKIQVGNFSLPNVSIKVNETQAKKLAKELEPYSPSQDSGPCYVVQIENLRAEYPKSAKGFSEAVKFAKTISVLHNNNPLEKSEIKLLVVDGDNTVDISDVLS